MKNAVKTIAYYVIFLVIVLLLAQFVWGTPAKEDITYSVIVQYFKEEKIEKFTIDVNNVMTYKLVDENRPYKYTIRDLALFHADLGELIIEQHQKGIIKSYEYESPKQTSLFIIILPFIIVCLIIALLYFAFFKKSSSSNSAQQNQSSGGGFGRGGMGSFSRAKTKLGADEKHKVFFKDVAGADEEKEELKEVVDFLKNPKKYSELGAKIPKGVLLVGAPGTGKTLLAKAVAGESGVPFYSISGSDFVEMYVGVGASRVRDLFDVAKKTAPCIVFIDEIDAVGRHRGAGWGGGHDEREQTLNQLLVEMDGFGGNDGVIVMAATNRPDILDPALLRPGRFDRQITVGYPDIKGREEILKVHARNKPLEEGVDLAVVAKSTAGFSGADLANLLNEAALLAARKNKRMISMTDIEEASLKVILGPQKKSMIIKPEEKRKTAIHEAGHAIVAKRLKTQDPVHHISVIPSGNALGVTVYLPEEDKHSVYKTELFERIAVMLAGRTAEELLLDDISGGASNDIQRATETARKMVTQLGMSDVLGPIVFGTGHDEVFLGKDFQNSRNYSEEVASKIDEEIHKIITAAHELARKILEDDMDKLKFIAEYLTAYEVMDGEQFDLVMNGEPTIEEVLAIRTAKQEKSRLENEKLQKAPEEPKTESTAEASNDDSVIENNE